jgi:hypothetical protein
MAEEDFYPVRPRLLALSFLFFAFVLPAARAQQPAEPAKPAMPEAMGDGMAAMHHAPIGPVGPLKISFNGKTEEWTADTLAPLPHQTVALYNAHTKTTRSYTGVPLTLLLTRLGVPDKPHGKDLRFYLVASGADGYRVVYSVAEVTPDIHTATVLVADSIDGKPLGDAGPLQLVASGETRPARWVRSLVGVAVESIP